MAKAIAQLRGAVRLQSATSHAQLSQLAALLGGQGTGAITTAKSGSADIASAELV
jgi:hypothetical protein